MKKRNVFQNQSQEILSLFEMAKDRSKVMCIPIDYAKKDHLAMLCDGNGKIIRKPFAIFEKDCSIAFFYGRRNVTQGGSNARR